jgi:hypothetical protein
MAESHVVSALVNKRAEIAGMITRTEQQLGLFRADLVHLDATAPGQASSLLSPTESARIRQQCAPRSHCTGRTVRQKVDNEAEARETTDVRPGENRSPPGQADRRRLNL